jgi:hypothetical protein
MRDGRPTSLVVQVEASLFYRLTHGSEGLYLPANVEVFLQIRCPFAQAEAAAHANLEHSRFQLNAAAVPVRATQAEIDSRFVEKSHEIRRRQKAAREPAAKSLGRNPTPSELSKPGYAMGHVPPSECDVIAQIQLERHIDVSICARDKVEGSRTRRTIGLKSPFLMRHAIVKVGEPASSVVVESQVIIEEPADNDCAGVREA